MRLHPHLFQAHALAFLDRVSRKYGRPLTLGSVPEEEWQQLAALGFDWVWLMGLWQRSPWAAAHARRDPGLRKAFDGVLGSWGDDDVAGSPYAVFGYRPEPALGSPEELPALRERLNRAGLRLMLDFVPNHLARDHPWLATHPERFLRPTAAARGEHPEWFFEHDGAGGFAHGRDPYFAPWIDTVQVNYFSESLRGAWREVLRRIAEVSDGVRCDMAMLGLTSVYRRVWGELLGDRDAAEGELWAELIGSVRREHPQFVFMAEVYWGLEGELFELGFDFAYDKMLYDQLLHSDAAGVRAHLNTAAEQAPRLTRFIENHDEERARYAFGRDRSLAAAAVLATLPGLRLFHDGQLDGRRTRLPIHLARDADVPGDPSVRDSYERLLAVTDDQVFHDGDWRMLPVARNDDSDDGQAADHDDHESDLLVWSWRHRTEARLVVVNWSGQPSRGLVSRDVLGGAAASVAPRDELAGSSPGGERWSERGLEIDLEPWGWKIYDVGG